VCAGQKRARNQGKTMGRPRVSYEIEQQIIDHREQGMGMKKIAKTLKIGVSVVQRVVHLLEMECS
jgi:DNA invertase Pin-like site-specific DNA recombinase